jgi:hypothetical protein
MRVLESGGSPSDANGHGFHGRSVPMTWLKNPRPISGVFAQKCMPPRVSL